MSPLRTSQYVLFTPVHKELLDYAVRALYMGSVIICRVSGSPFCTAQYQNEG